MSRNWIKNFWSTFKNEIPDNFRICCENLYAQHSINYEDLESYAYCFSIWNGDLCLSWDETLEWFKLLNLKPVNVLYDDIFDEESIRKMWKNNPSGEGYVIRLANEFLYDDFKSNVAKFVRKNHVQTEQHWMYQELKVNKLKIL